METLMQHTSLASFEGVRVALETTWRILGVECRESSLCAVSQMTSLFSMCVFL